MLSRWSGIFQIAAVYVGTVVGAGFATGREIVEFFTRYGIYGFIGILIARLYFYFYRNEDHAYFYKDKSYFL